MEFITKIQEENFFKNLGVFNRHWHFWNLQSGPILNPLATYIVYFYQPKNDIFPKTPAHQFRFWENFKIKKLCCKISCAFCYLGKLIFLFNLLILILKCLIICNFPVYLCHFRYGLQTKKMQKRGRKWPMRTFFFCQNYHWSQFFYWTKWPDHLSWGCLFVSEKPTLIKSMFVCFWEKKSKKFNKKF